jgi:transposase InsO family protein
MQIQLLKASVNNRFLQIPVECTLAKDYTQVLRDHRMMPSMSRPGNPYDNVSCESFMKALKREEIYANDYPDLEHLVESDRLHDVRADACFPQNTDQAGKHNAYPSLILVSADGQHLRSLLLRCLRAAEEHRT